MDGNLIHFDPQNTSPQTLLTLLTRTEPYRTEPTALALPCELALEEQPVAALQTALVSSVGRTHCTHCTAG
jgi:hypothetical protein